MNANEGNIINIKIHSMSLLAGPVLALISSFLPWVITGNFIMSITTSGFETFYGQIFFLLALLSLGVSIISQIQSRGKILMIIGVIMAACTIDFFYKIIIRVKTLSLILINVDAGIGLYLALIASLIIVYTGYKTNKQGKRYCCYRPL